MAAKIEALISLENFRHNLACVRRLAPSSRVLAVVKADAYGHGVRGLLPALAGADALAVAHIDEALELRTLTAQPVVILEGFLNAEEWRLCREQALTPVLHNDEQLQLLEALPPAAGSSLWIKIDTGMHRLGFDAPRLPGLRARLLRLAPSLDLTAMTHFARSEEAAHALTARQIDAFDAANAEARLPASMANSGAIIGWPRSHREWVRPGLMLYGVAPSTAALDLRPVMTLRSRVIALRDVAAGDEVGYNGRWRAPRATRIATVAVGYADGYPTQVRDGAPVLLNGTTVHVAGRPSMDMITLDVGSHSDAAIGDQAVLWGEGLAIAEIARHADTIAYQLLTGVSKRVTRVYR